MKRTEVPFPPPIDVDAAPADQLLRDVAKRVIALNHWHEIVNRDLAVLDERLKWVLIVSSAFGSLGLGLKVFELLTK